MMTPCRWCIVQHDTFFVCLIYTYSTIYLQIYHHFLIFGKVAGDGEGRDLGRDLSLVRPLVVLEATRPY